MNRTKIEWVKNPDGTQGYTWNPITGCLNGCDYCYARKLAWGRLCLRYIQNSNVAESDIYSENYAFAMTDPFYPRFWEDRLDELLPPLAKVNYERYGFQCRRFEPYRKAERKPKGIFVCDMSDLFGIGIPEEWTKKVINMIKQNRQDRFYLLTKQPQNLIKFSPFPDNCWVGVTATDEMMARRAIQQLRYVQVNVRFLSLEPLLGEIRNVQWDVLNWVIIGALTGSKADLLPIHHRTGLMMVRLNGNRWSLQPQIEWVREIVEACDKTGIPVFLKNNLIPMLKKVDYILPTNIAMGAYLRQEMPEGR